MSEVRDQDDGVRFLRKVVEGSLTSALLLVGDEGVGKRFSVTEAAKEEFLKTNSKADYQIDQGLHPDFKLVSPEDNKDIGIQAIRDVIAVTRSYPSTAPKRYVVIDGADKLTDAAANAFLKTLEEAPKFTQFFLLANSSESVLPTIRSRCGKVRYKRLSETFVTNSLSKFETDPTKALVYARLADGSLGRALQFFGSSRLALRDRALSLLRIGLGKDLSNLFLAIDDMKGDLPLVIHFLDHLLYDLAMLPHLPDRISNLDLSNDLQGLLPQLGIERVLSLGSSVRVLRDRKSVDLTHHLKALMASAFLG